MGVKNQIFWTEIIPVACVLRGSFLKRVPALWDKKTEKARENYITNVIRAKPNRVNTIKNRNRLGGREQPPSADKILGGSTRFSAIQPDPSSGVIQNSPDVKKIQAIMSVINALKKQNNKKGTFFDQFFVGLNIN